MANILLVADVHANLVAFQCVLEDAGRGGAVDEIWCLGDLVGYGPDPGACIELLRAHPHLAVAGNHDRAAIGAITTDEFNQNAATAVSWTADQLLEEQRAFLSALPEVAVWDDFTLVHGSLREPLWEYLVSEPAAAAHFDLLETPYSFIGHSHFQLGFLEY